ncbi:MAG: hypothetical protein WAX77_06010 [Methylococcaceae bacterium]
MNTVIESTNRFEKEIDSLNDADKKATIDMINHCAECFENRKINSYRQELKRKLSRMAKSNLVLPNDYGKSSLYVLKINRNLRAILAIDEDPIFEQVIFTLFRVVKVDEIEKAYKGVAESLYQNFINTHTETLEFI